MPDKNHLSRLKAELSHLRQKNRQLHEALQQKSFFPDNNAPTNDSYQNLVELAADAIFTGDPEGNITGANQSAVLLSGFSQEELIGRNLQQFFSTEEHQRAPLRYDLLQQGQIVITERLLQRKDGSTVPIEMNSRMMPDGTFHTFIRDISERQEVEKALRTSESQLKSIFRAADVGIGLVIDRVFQETNRCLSIMTGYSREELIGQSTRMLYPDDAEYEYVGQAKYTQIDIQGAGTVETRWQRKDGQIIHVLLSSSPLDPANLALGVTFTALDITERKQVETALLESEENLRKTIDSIGDAVFLMPLQMDGQARFVMVNDYAVEHYGYSREEFLQLTTLDITRTEDMSQESRAARREQVLDRGRLVFETVHRKNSGTMFPVEISVNVLTLNGKKHLLSVARDISQRKHLEQENLRRETLENIGTLAGGIAHDFNNILMGLFGNIAIAKRKLGKEHPAYRSLEKAESSTNRATNLTRKLLTFAKGGEPIKESLSLGELVQDVVSFDLSGSNVKLVFDQTSQLYAVHGDKGQYQQVFSNLAINADQAMPEGGHLFISLINEIDPDAVMDSGLPAGHYVKAIVRDEGEGIPPEHLQHIFDPYYSTKQAGSGLGLATVYSIVNRHGGHIDVESFPGQGTTFTLYLPASSAEPMAADELQKDLHIGFEGCRILVMDDDETILNLVADMLTELGCSVETSRDGLEAGMKYRQALSTEAPYRLVIMDLTIPGNVGGKEAVQEILKLDPQAKVIVSSGYAEDPVMANYTDYGFRGIIAKPYTMEELQKVLKVHCSSS